MSLCANLALLSLAFSATAAFAADAAERKILGFSPDGRYFAFEQFGVQDGSGFPYSEIYIVDLASDGWLDGTPIRVRFDDETKRLESARRKAMDGAAPYLKKVGIEDNAQVLAGNPVNQQTSDARKLIFRSYYSTFGHLEPVEPEDEHVVSLVLEETVLPTPEGCPIGDTPFAGFVLKVKRGGEAFEEVHRDNKIPASRQCPLKYSLSDAVALVGGNGQIQRMVVLVNVFSYGFEGADRRFIAVPLK
jgi:predicted secreted protein